MENRFEPIRSLDHDQEKKRLARLYDYNVIGKHQASGTFQHVASMAAWIFNTPIALVNFVDQDSILINSSVGMAGFGRKVAREISLCSVAILRNEVTVLENAAAERSLLDNPIIHGEFGLKFYAAAPLKTPDGFNIGVVAVADRKPREFSAEDELLLEGLAAVVMDELEERQTNAHQQ